MHDTHLSAMSTQSASGVRRLSEEVFIKGSLAVVDEIVPANFRSHDPPPGAPATGDGLRGIAEAVTTAFSDRVQEYDEFVATIDGRVVES